MNRDKMVRISHVLMQRYGYKNQSSAMYWVEKYVAADEHRHDEDKGFGTEENHAKAIVEWSQGEGREVARQQA
jgi:hypothetical protein